MYVGASVKILIEPINTKAQPNIKLWEDGFRDLLRTEGREIWEYFEQVTRAFMNHSVELSQTSVRRSGGDLSNVTGVLDGGADNAVFSYVNWGTMPRMIYPVNYNMLIFRPNYKRATHPGSLSVTPPWVKDGDYVRFFSVSHPGIEPRRFDELIQYLAQADMNNQARKDVARLAKRMWK